MDFIKMSKVIVKENVRHDYGDLTELAVSIKENGIRKPLELNSLNELVDGFRRFKAAKAAGLEEVPYFYNGNTIDNMTEQIISGIFSKNLNAVEEGKAFKKYMDKEKINVEVMAKKISKPVIYVEKRLLVANLPKEAQEALIENKILIGHAVILSKFTKEDSIKVLKDIIKQKMGVEALRDHLQYRFSTQISNALFDKKDCKNCKYNGSCQSELFETGKVLNGNCMNLGCFMKKKNEFVKQLKEEYKDVLFNGKDEWEEPKGFDELGHNARITKAYAEECRKSRENYLVKITEHGEVKEYFKIPTKKVEHAEPGEKQDSNEKQEPSNTNSIQEFKKRFLIEKSIELMIPGTKESKVLTLVQLINKANYTELELLKKELTGLIPGIFKDGDYNSAQNIKKIFDAKEKDIDKAISIMSKFALWRVDLKALMELSEHFGVDMKKHFLITEEFLKLNTTDQLQGMIKEFGLEQKEVKSKNDWKKGELIQTILDNDTKGKVPKTLS